MATGRKKEKKAKNVVLVVGTQQYLSNLYSLDIYVIDTYMDI